MPLRTLRDPDPYNVHVSWPQFEVNSGGEGSIEVRIFANLRDG